MTSDDKPSYTPQYKQDMSMIEDIENKLKAMESNQIIENAISPWNSPIMKNMEYIWKIITFNESYKKVSQDFRKVSPKIISSSWRKNGTPRFASFDSVAADK